MLAVWLLVLLAVRHYSGSWVYAAVVQFEGRIIHERMSKGKRRKAAGGGYTGGWLPYGYRLEDGRVVAVSEEARVVERIFRWRARGRSLEWIRRRLNANGTKTRRNGEWRVSTIRGMLGNRFYTGRVEFDGDLIRAQHDAIVSDLLFDRAAQRNGRPARATVPAAQDSRKKTGKKLAGRQ